MLQKSKSPSVNHVVAASMITLFIISSSIMALAQGKGAAAVASFRAAQKEKTNIAGVSIIVDRPKRFNPLTASNEELGRYGLPQRPDGQADPKGFRQWSRGMQALKYRAAAHLKAMPFSSKNLVMAKTQPVAPALSGMPSQYYSYNWSGVANTKKRTTWSDAYSFDYITSLWNVPAAQPPFGACANGIMGAVGVPGFYEVSWNGIDGFDNGDVLQGGSLSYSDCGGPADSQYVGWVEWYPSYPIETIECNYGGGNVPCIVNAGDDFLVETFGTGPDATAQYVFVEDATQGWYGTFELDYITGPYLVGSSEEQIVERPCCDADGYPLALANYLADFFDYASGTDGKGLVFWPGNEGPYTAILTMVDDNDDQPISTVNYGTQGFQGKYSLFFESEDCAYEGGCISD